MSAKSQTVAFIGISLVVVFFLAVIAALTNHPYTTFEGATTIQLSMVVCYLVSINANTSLRATELSRVP